MTTHGCTPERAYRDLSHLLGLRQCFQTPLRKPRTCSVAFNAPMAIKAYPRKGGRDVMKVATCILTLERWLENEGETSVALASPPNVESSLSLASCIRLTPQYSLSNSFFAFFLSCNDIFKLLNFVRAYSLKWFDMFQTFKVYILSPLRYGECLKL